MAILLLASAGLMLSVTVLFLTKGALSPVGRWLTGVCRMDGDACAVVFHHPHARLPGIPNAVAGALFYAAVIVAVASENGSLLAVVRVLSAAAVAASVFLAWSLLVVVRRRCVLCTAAHVVNIALALLLNM